jgi:hypothetical protein
VVAILLAGVLFIANINNLLGQGASQFFAGLSGTNEVQHVSRGPIGDAEFNLDGSNLTVSVNVTDGEYVAAGIYGPAAVGYDGPLVFDLGYAPVFEADPPCYPSGSSWSSSFSLTPRQLTNLAKGLYYVNITNTAYPDGVLRGQILPAGPPVIISGPYGNLVTSIAYSDLFALSVYAWGTDLSIQWMNNGYPIAYGNYSCFSPNSTTNAGQVYVVVSNPWGSVTSSVSYVSIDNGPLVPPAKMLKVASALNPPNAGAVDGAGQFWTGSAVTLNETTTNDWYHFSSWSQGGKLLGTNSYVIIMVSNNESVTANFALNSYHVSTTAFPTNAGTLSGTALRDAGTRATVTASAKAGFLFSNWTENGQVVSAQADYTFVVTNDTALTANFVSNGFLAARGMYSGLFFDPTNVAANTAGMLSGLAVGGEGVFSGNLRVGGTSYWLDGKFDVAGFWSNRIARPAAKGGPLTLEMNLDWNQSPPVITGWVTGTNGGPWTNALYAERAGANLSCGDFTLLIPPGNGPPGDGYALITEHAGQVTINGKLADGTAFGLAVAESDSGDVPLYASLYSGSGLLLGWLNFASGAPAGDLAWVRPASRAGLYTNGFTNCIEVQGSAWTNSAPLHAGIAMTNGQMEIWGGPLETPLAFNVAVKNNNALVKLRTSPATNTLAGTINGKTGLLTVTFGDGKSRETITGYGVVLQDRTNGAGFFVTKTNAGAISVYQP